MKLIRSRGSEISSESCESSHFRNFTPADNCWAGVEILSIPNLLAVPGIICMSPVALRAETTPRWKLDSSYTSDAKRRQSQEMFLLSLRITSSKGDNLFPLTEKKSL